MGLLSWDSGEHQVDLEKELATLTAQAPEGEEARYGERLIQFASENLVTEILIHPQMNTLMQCMRNLLSSFTRHRHLVHAGYTFAGNGSWIMQDGTFSLADFTDAYQENEVQRVIRAYENSISIDVHCSTSGGGDWAKLPDMPFVKYCKIRVNPTDILDSGSQAIKDFIAYLEPYVVPASLDQLLVPSEVVGNIRFTHPTLYVFPGGQGDAALFGINGFNMLVDGGFSRKACWWDFARHLDRLDAVLFTRLNNCSVSGMASVLRRKASATVYPQIGHFFCNLEERRMLASPDGDKDSDPLLVSLIQEGSDMMADLRHINLKPQHCYRNPEPINLYHKVGHGTLDMYVLNPSKDSKYVREFLKRWHNSEQKLFEGASVSGQFNFPIPNLVSICALLVWRPANPDDTITRIMFPGSTPQHKIFEGLEKLKHLEFLQYPTCTGRQMAAATTTVTAATTTVTSIKTTTKATPKTSKEKSISSEKMKDEKIMEPEPPPKDMKAEDIKNIIDNKLLNELVDGDDKIESVLCDTIAARLETKLDDKIAQYESTVIDGLPKKKEAKKKTVEKTTKRIDKTDEAKDSVIKAELKKIDAETKPKVEKKKVDTRKVEMTSSVTKSRVSHRAIRSVSEKKTTVATLDKKSTTEEKKSPPTTPKKTLDTKTTSTVSGVKDKVKVKARKLSPGSTTAKSTKEAKNRMVVESKYKQLSPKRDTSAKAIEKKETKAKREPISRRPRPLSSPVKGLKTMKSPSKSIKSTKTDTSKLKGLQRVNYEDILKEAKKSDEDTSKSLDDIKQQELDEREEQEIVREIEAVFNRDIEAEEKVEFVGRSDIEKITCLIDDTKTETTADGEFEEEYLIIEKEEVDQYIEDSVVDHVSSHEHADELQKHVKDKEESEKKKDVTVLETEKPEETKAKTEVIIEKELKQVESKEHSVSLEEKQDVSSEKKTSDSKSIQKPKDSLEMQVQESQPDEKISTTIESGATTAPTLPEDERITLDDIKEDQQIEEKHIQEETKELIAPQGLVHTNIVSLEKSPKLESIPAPVREIVKTPDEVADLPLHEVVDYRTFEDKKTPEEEGIQRKIYEVKVPKDLPIPDQDATVPYRIRTVEDDIVLKTVQRASHAELVTVTPGSAPESPMYHEQIKVSVIPDKDLQTVKEYDDTDYNYGQFTEKLRETHITTIDSPIKDDIIVIEEVPCMPEKIPSIPEDVEKEIEEARKLELAEKPPLSPKDVEKIVADVAEVLKSDRSLEEIMAEKSPLLSKSPEVFNKMDTSLSVIEATKLLLSSEQEIQHDSRKEINKTKSLASKIELDITDTLQKEASPVRSITSEDVSEVSDKTVLSEGKRIKRELLDEKPEQKSVIKTVTDEMEAGKMYTESHDSVHEYTESEKKVTTALESARTLEKLEEKIADLKKKPLVIETDIKDIDKKSAAKEISPSKEVLPKKTLLQKAETKAEKVVGKVSALKDEVFGFFSKKSTEKKEPSPEKDLLDRKKDTSGKITDLLGHSEKESSLVKSRDEIIPVKFDQNTHDLIKLDSRSASEQKQQEPNFVFNEDEELFIAEQLKDYEPTGQPEEHSFSQLTTLSENEILIKRKTTITTLIQEYCNTTMTVTIYKVTYLTTEEDEQLDGSKTSRTIRKISLVNERPKPKLDADIKKEVLSLQKPHSTEVLPEKAADEELSSQLHAEVELASKPNEKKKDSPMLRKTTPSPEKAFSLVSSEEDHRSRHMTTRRTPSPVPSKELGPTLSKKVSSPEPTEKAASPATSEKAVSPVLSETLFKKAPSIMPSQKQSILIPREHSPTSEPTAKLDQKTSGPVTREKGFIKTHDKKSPSPVQSDESLYSESGIQSAFDNEQAIDEQLKGFKTYAKPEEQTSTQTVTLTIENVIIIRKIITKIVIEEYFNINNTIVQYKIIKIIIEEDQNPDGTTTSRTHRVVSLSKDKPEISELLRSKSYLEETNGKSPTGLLEDEMKLTRGEDYCDEDGFIIEKGMMDRDHKVVALSETKKSMKDELAITIDKKPLSPEISEAVLNSVPEKEPSQEKKAQTEEVDQEKLFERLEDDISETEIVRGTVDITSDNEIVDIKRILSPLSSKEDSKQLISEKDDDDESIKEHKTIVTKETNELTSNLKIAKDVIDNICKDTMLVTRKIELDENLKEDIVFDKLDEKQVGLEKDILKRKECASEIDGEVKKVSSFIVKATPAIDATIKLPELETLSKLDQPEKPKTKDKMIEALKLENGHLEPSHLSEEMPSEISPTLNKKLISPESRKEILIEKVVTPEPREELSEKAPSASASYMAATESRVPINEVADEKSPSPVLSKKLISDDVADRLITEREIESDDIQEMEKKLEGFKAVGSEKESTITRNITVIENNISIKRKLVITTILQEFRCVTKSTTIYKITTVTVEEDSLPDGSIITRTSKKTLLSDKPTVEIISTLPLDKVPNLIEKTLFEPELYPSEKEPSDKAHSPVPSEKLPADEPLASAHSNGVPYPITSEKETSDRSPSLVSSEKTLSDGTPSPVSSETLPNGKLSLPRPVQQDKDTSSQVEEIQLTTDENQEIDNFLKEFEAIGNLEETTTSKNFTVTENSVTIKRKLFITTQVQRFYSVIKKITMYKVITITVTEDEHPDGSKVTKRTKNVLLSDKAPETNELSPHVSDEVSFSEVPKGVPCESDKALSPGPSKKVSDTLATCVTSEEEPHDKVSTATLTEKTLSERTHSPVASPKVSDDKSHSSIPIEKIPDLADQKTSYILSEKTLIDQDSTSIVGEQLQVLSLVSSTKPTSPDSTAKLPSKKTTEEVSQDKVYSPTPTDLTPSGKTSVPELSEHGPSDKPSRPFAIDKKLEEIKAVPNGQIPSLSDKLQTEKSGVTKKEIERISKDDEKDIDEKELSKQPNAEYMISKSVDVVPTKTLEKSVDESTEVQDIDTDVYEDGESISEDSQIIDIRKDSQVTMTKLDSLQKFPNQTEPVDAHYKVKRSVIEEKPDDNSLTDTLSHKPHGSSSEDVSKEVSLEEKYSFEGTEKSEKKSTQKDYAKTQKVDSMSSLDSLTQTLKQYDSKVDKDKTQEPGSPRDEILQSEASDSGVHSIPIEVDSTGQMDTTVTRTIKDNAVNLMESIHKAFGEEIVQQGIKTESLESLVRVSTPPTVPVSPLPKTPSGFQDVKMSDGVQSEVTYDKSDGSEEIITKVVHVGEDVLTQRISTSTEKAPKKPSALIDEDADILTLMQTMGKIKTETDTVTKIIKEGENVVTQTITTVTTKEVISREDGTPQNIKTTIETTTLSKGADGTTTTTTDTQTLLSECSSSLRSTSSMDLYAKDKIEKEYLDIDEKFEMMNLPDKREPSIPIDVDSDFKSFISESEETDDDVEDTIIDTDVSKRIIREKNIDIIETIITVTKKETVRISDCKKLIRTTVETTITKEYPDGSRDVQKNVEVKTEELLLDSGSNLDKILSEYVIFGEPEESVSTKTEELKQDNHLIKRSFVTRIVKVKYADNRGVPRKLKTTTVITTTDDYPDGSSRTKVDSSTSLTDIDKETVESPELEELTIIENKSIESEKQDKTVLINGKNVLQIITVTTTKETLANIDRSKRKLKTTVETVTETMLPDGMTEVTKDVKISLSDVGIDTLKENLEGFKPIGKPKEDTTMKSATIIEDGVSIKRKTTITTITSEYINVSKSIKRTKTIIKTVLEDEHPDGSVIIKTNEKISLSDETLDRTTECEERDRKEKELESQLKELCPLEEPEITESVKREEIKDQTTIIHRTIITRVVKTKYCNSQGIACKLKIVTTTSTTDTYPDGTTKTQVNVSTVVTNIISEDTLTSTHVQKDENKLSQISKKVVPETTDSIKSEISPEKEIPLEEELDGLDESAKIDNALRELTVQREPDESESVETIEIVENNTVIKRSITTRIVKTTYVDKAGKPRKLKIVTTVTTTDNFPDGSARTTVEGSTTVTDIEPELSDTIEENLEGFNTTGTPNEDITTHEEIVTDNGVVVKRKTTITTTTQKYRKENVIRTKTTVKTVTEDEHPDGSVITKTSEKVSLVDEYVENLNEDKETTENIKIEAALKDLIPTSEPEVTEAVVTENIKENLITIVRTITTKTAKTRYADNLGVLRKLKVVITVTTIDKYPDGSLRKTVDTNTSIIDVESADLVKGQDLKEYPELEDKIVNVDTQEKLEIRDGKQVKQIITTTTIKETLSSVDGSRKKIRTTVETVTETKLPDGLTEVTKDVKVSVADYGVETFDENLTGFTELGKPEESTTTDTKSIVENGITILRKTTITTVRQEFENASIRSRKIKTTVKTVIEDEHPDGTVIIKKSEKVSIADVILRPSGTSESDTQPPESYIDGSEIVEDTTEDSDVKNEVIQQGSLTIKRTITTKTKRETLASTDKNIKRVRTTVETVTVDEFPDGSTETTKDVKITISEFQKTSDSDLQAALQGLTSTGKVKTSVDKKTSLIYEQGEKVTQTITTYVTKEELSNNETNEIAVKTVTETITENAKDDGSIETTKDVRTQITYLPIGTGLDDWSPEELAEIEKQPVVQEEKQVLDDKPVFAQLHLGSKDDKKSTEKLKKQRSPVGEITTDTETFTNVINEGDNEITQTITIVTTKEVISPEKIKITVETTTVSKGSDGITKTTKSTKTTISEFKEEFEETIDKGESEKSFSKMSTKTSDMRSSSAASDDFDHHGISSPPSDISSRGSRAATRVWGTESSGVYYSDDDGPGSPSSTKSQIAHSPRSNLSFELDSTRSQLDQLEKQDSTLYREQTSTSSYEKNLNDELRSSITHTEHKSEGHTGKTATQITDDFLSKEKMGHLKQTDVTFLKEADEHFEKAIEEHKKVSGPEVISNITAKYKLDKKVHSISSQSSKQESAITLKDLKTEIKKGSESSSTSKQELKQTSDTRTSNDPIESWGKPLGLPSPIMPTTQADSKNTPKKQASATVLNKNKINQEKSKEAKRSSESPNKKKAPAPVYMELTYVPHHGNSYYSAVEFFKRVRARYYVFSGTEPSKEIYNALLDAKKTWEDKDLEVTIIPTYDTDVLGYWVTENEEALEKYKIDLSPSASRCTINLQDHETSCAAYRLEF
ncbi:unnamed protein product [Arctia plantaginis]|uniref:Microtubule-associated protein futsch n=1 Tax=Arctia plantaginis TaxID=874455 RepID=A0A8S1AGF0_ARCPL|nr:unnamed protein product [Arctia plantaginis]